MKGEGGRNGKEGNGTMEEAGGEGGGRGGEGRLNATLAKFPAILASRDVMALVDGLGAVFEMGDADVRLELPVKRARTLGNVTDSLRRAVADPCAEKMTTATTTEVEPSDAELINALEAQVRQAEEPTTLPSYLSDLVCRPVDSGSRVYADPGTSDAPLDVVRCRMCSKVVLASCFAKHLLVCTAQGARSHGDGNEQRAALKSNDNALLKSERGAGAGAAAGSLSAMGIGIQTADGADAGDAKAKTKKKKKKKPPATASAAGAMTGGTGAAMASITAAGKGISAAGTAGGAWPGGGGALDKEIPTCTPIFFASGNGNGGTQEDDAGQAGGIGSQADGAGLKKRKKKTTLVSQLNKGPAPAAGGDSMYDLNESCGVVFTSGVKLGMRCTHPLLSCKLHTTDQKKKVVGRALPYEQLVKKLIAERKAARAAGAAVRRGMNHESSATNRFQPVRVSKPLVVGYGASNGMSVLRRAEMKGVLRSIFQSSKSFIQSRGAVSNGASDKAPPQQRTPAAVSAMHVDTAVQSYPQDMGGIGVAGGGIAGSGGVPGMKMNLYSYS